MRWLEPLVVQVRRLALDEGVIKESQSCFLVEGKVSGKSSERQLWP